MKRLTHLLFSLLLIVNSHAQREKIDSLKAKLQQTSSDSLKVIYYRGLCDLYFLAQPDSALLFAFEGLKIATELSAEKRRSQFLTRIGNLLHSKGNFPQALENHLASLKISEAIDDQVGEGASYNNIGEVYKEQGDARNALQYFAKAKFIFEDIVKKLRSESSPVSESKAAEIQSYKSNIGIILLNVGDMYERLNLLDSALLIQQQAFASATENQDEFLFGAIHTNLGAIFTKMEKPMIALDHFRKAIPYLEVEDDKRFIAIAYLGIGEIYEKSGNDDSALIFSRKSLVAAREGSFQKEILNAAIVLSRVFEKKLNPDSAFFYQKLVASVKDTIFSQENVRKVEAMNFGEKTRQEELVISKAKAAVERRDKLQYMIISIAIVSVFIVLILLRKRKSKTKLIEYMGVIGLLLLFEFIALFLHPFIGHWTHHKPIYMLLVLAGIGAILTPLHHILTKWIKRKFIHKNSVEPKGTETSEYKKSVPLAKPAKEVSTKDIQDDTKNLK